MYSGERHIDTGEAMRHNEQVEQARRAEHLRRCAVSPAYKRVYDRLQDMMATMQCEQSKVADAIRQAMQQQTVTDVMGHCKEQPVRIGRPEPLPPPSELNQLAVPGGALGVLLLAGLFMTDERWAQIPEDLKAMKEMRQVDEEYDRQIIRLSGFEW